MNITKDTVVTLTFRASDASGKLLEDGKTPRSYLHGGYGNTLPGIEAALEGQAAGYQTTVKLAPGPILVGAVVSTGRTAREPSALYRHDGV